jgi:hypothetical protein
VSFGPALANFIRAVVGPVDYYAQHPARVLAQNGDGTLELQPDSPRIPALSAVPLRGLPGVAVKVAAGARVLVGFESGNPGAPVAMLWEASGLLELTVTVVAPAVHLGEASPAYGVALAEKVQAELTTLKGALTSAVTVPMDGGTSFKATVLAALASWPSAVGSGTVKAKG